MLKKNRKWRKGRNKGFSTSGNLLSYGKYGIKCINRGKIRPVQIESGRRIISRYIKKIGKFWIRIYPDKPFTKKPIEVRMGGGKGEIEGYIFNIKPGRIIYELSDITEKLAFKIFRLVSFKLPFKTIFVKN